MLAVGGGVNGGLAGEGVLEHGLAVGLVLEEGLANKGVLGWVGG